LILAIVGLVGVLALLNTLVTDPSTPREPRHVRYIAEGLGHVDLTYINETGGTQQDLAKLLWSMDFKAAPGARLYLSAQLSIQGGGISRLAIEVNNVEIQRAQTYREFGVATVSGIAQ
jgi:hypothetical protein